jgi:MarR family 2-MHQ and catechol resistance regulon transcriptional repressor
MSRSRYYGDSEERALALWVKLARAYSTFNKGTVQDIRRYGLTQPQFAVLECLGHLGPMMIGELSRKMLVSGGNMTCVVDNLERDGLVERQHDANDRRSVIVALTDKGRALLEELFPQHAAFIANAVSALTPEEQSQLAQLLKKLGTSLQE